jgi:thymidylate synthase (FAD)
MNTAKIVAITNPLIEGVESADKFIAYAARVSNPSNQMNTGTSEKLLRYCIKNKHFSIFEMVNVVMEIDTTRDIARQILRHRSFSFQEFSQRYADPTKDLGFVTREARLQDFKNRQNSIEVEDDHELMSEWNRRQLSLIEKTSDVYDWAIRNGIAKEQARAVLPEGLTKSRMYMNGTLRSWIHYISVRTEIGTQKEHREVAMSAKDEIVKAFPFLDDYFDVS